MLAGCSTQGQAAATGSEVASWMSSSAGGAAIGQTAADSRNIAFTLSHRDPAFSAVEELRGQHLFAEAGECTAHQRCPHRHREPPYTGQRPYR